MVKASVVELGTVVQFLMPATFLDNSYHLSTIGLRYSWIPDSYNYCIMKEIEAVVNCSRH